MFHVGFGESLIVTLVVAIVYLIPIAVVTWIIVTLRQVRADHAWIRNKLESIEQMLHKGSAE